MTVNDGTYGSSLRDLPRTPPWSGLHGKRETSIRYWGGLSGYQPGLRGRLRKATS
jgi:hypothetical protein